MKLGPVLLMAVMLISAPNARLQPRTNTWLTYTDPEGRFTFHYPPESTLAKMAGLVRSLSITSVR